MCGDETLEIFIDALAILLELLEYLVKLRLRIHSRRLSDEASDSNPLPAECLFVRSC
jgi:hypothetical protein